MTKENTKKEKTKDTFSLVCLGLGRAAISLTISTYYGLLALFTSKPIIWLNVFSLLVFSFSIGFNETYHRIFFLGFDKRHAFWITEYLTGLTPMTQGFMLMAITLYFSMLFLGRIRLANIRSFNRIFERAGLKNSEKEIPEVKNVHELSELRTQLTVSAPGISLSDFFEKKDKIASAKGQSVESICQDDEPGRYEIIFSSVKIPKSVKYEDFSKLSRPECSFFVGETQTGPLIQDLSSLPHMLAAGTAGFGKSNFVTQAVMSILETTPYLQAYLIDLKGGADAKQFKKCKNVKVLSDLPSALDCIKQIEEERKSRQDVVEASEDRTSIDLRQDKKDRILLCIDEASELFIKDRANPEEKKTVREAIEIMDRIVKLGRAYSINVILATQKVLTTTIPRGILENLEGRICFKAETVANSTAVLNKKDAINLPQDIKGRAIWKKGAELIEVQVPFISNEQIKERCKSINKRLESKAVQLFQPMIVKDMSERKKTEFTTDLRTEETVSA